MRGKWDTVFKNGPNEILKVCLGCTVSNNNCCEFNVASNLVVKKFKKLCLPCGFIYPTDSTKLSLGNVGADVYVINSLNAKDVIIQKPVNSLAEEIN